MKTAAARSREEVARLYEKHVDMVYRICFSHMKNPADAEDAVQGTFLRLIRACPVFKNEEHEKAWFIVTASNLCRDQLRHWWRRRESLDDHPELPSSLPPESRELLEALLSLPPKYKTVIYLYYYEGYSSQEIASLLKKPSSTIRTHLKRGRELLQNSLGGAFDER